LYKGLHEYSASPKHSNTVVNLKLTSSHVVVIDENYREIVTHKRLYGDFKQQSMDWLPYLKQLSIRSRALKYSGMSKLINSAGFYNIKTFDGFRFDEITLPSGMTPESLKSLDFFNERKNIIMYGRTGTGKTMLSTALGVTACQNGIPIKFFRTAALVNRLSEAKRDGTLGVILKKLDKASIVILGGGPV